MITGTYNFRDLGGISTANGTVKPGKIFRSDALHKLSGEGQKQLTDLGVKRVFDLRDDNERKYAPDVLPSGLELIPQPIFPNALAHIDRKLNIHSLTELIFFEHPNELVAAIDSLASEASPAVVHCTAGKDRTGAVIALVLSILGADRDDILHDYKITEENLSGEWLENHIKNLERIGAEMTPDVIGLVGSSPAEALESVLKRIDEEYGSPIDYLKKHGLKDSKMDSLLTSLVL